MYTADCLLLPPISAPTWAHTEGDRADLVDSLFNTDFYITDFNSIVGTIKAGIRQHCPVWSTSTPLPSGAVIHER